MRKYIYIIILSLFLYQCKDASDNSLTKEERVTDFKKEIIAVSDSATIYFDLGLKMLNEGENLEEISTAIRSKLTHFELEINKRTREFPTLAKTLELSQEEYDIIFKELSFELSKNIEKYKTLTSAGVKLN